MKFTLSTNVSFADFNMIKYTLPNWLRVFDQRLDELIVVVDPQKPTGRLAGQYNKYAELQQLMDSVESISKLDCRIRVEFLNDINKINQFLGKWFFKGYPYRCQSGTPISAFIYAVEECKTDFILRCDCDMLFFENGFLDEAIDRFQKKTFDILEPPLLGFDENWNTPASLGAFMIFKYNFTSNCLPMKAHKLDYFRRIHRTLKSRPVYLNLEEMVTIEKNENRIRHCRLDQSLGFSLHLINRDDVLLPNFENIIKHVEQGIVPDAQRNIGRNFNPALWSEKYWQ
jgi:hypothetical protein